MTKKLTVVALIAILSVVLLGSTVAATTPPGIEISNSVSGRVHPLTDQFGGTVVMYGGTPGLPGVWE